MGTRKTGGVGGHRAPLRHFVYQNSCLESWSCWGSPGAPQGRQWLPFTHGWAFLPWLGEVGMPPSLRSAQRAFSGLVSFLRAPCFCAFLPMVTGPIGRQPLPWCHSCLHFPDISCPLCHHRRIPETLPTALYFLPSSRPSLEIPLPPLLSLITLKL